MPIQDTLSEPPWFEGLPKYGRGFPVLAEAGWVNDEPSFSRFDMDRTIALAMHRACALCGYAMPKGKPVYRAFAQGDAAHIRIYEPTHSHDLAGPLHLSCILYSAIVCPLLREKTSKMGKDSILNPGGKRGSLAAIMGFRDMGLMINENLTMPSPGQREANFMVAYLELVDDIRYRDGEADLLGKYEEAVDQDKAIIDMSEPRLFWGPDDTTGLRTATTKIHEVRARKPVGRPTMIDAAGPFLTYPL